MTSRRTSKAVRAPIGRITARDVLAVVNEYLSESNVPRAAIGPANEVTFATQELSGYFDDEARYKTVHYRVTISKLD